MLYLRAVCKLIANGFFYQSQTIIQCENYWLFLHQRIALSNIGVRLCFLVGVLRVITAAENIPIEPEPANTGGGNR